MSLQFTKVKLSWPHSLRVVHRTGLDRFRTAGGRFVGLGSCRVQIEQTFQVPTGAFELQFQPVGPLAHIPHSPITRASLPPSKHGYNLTVDRTTPTPSPGAASVHSWACAKSSVVPALSGSMVMPPCCRRNRYRSSTPRGTFPWSSDTCRVEIADNHCLN